MGSAVGRRAPCRRCHPHLCYPPRPSTLSAQCDTLVLLSALVQGAVDAARDDDDEVRIVRVVPSVRCHAGYSNALSVSSIPQRRDSALTLLFCAYMKHEYYIYKMHKYKILSDAQYRPKKR